MMRDHIPKWCEMVLFLFIIELFFVFSLSVSASAKRIFTSMAIVMTFEVTAWFVSTALINLSQIIALPG